MNRRGTEPYARWCERTGEATPLPTRFVKNAQPDGLTLLGSHQTIDLSYFAGLADYSHHAFSPVALLTRTVNIPATYAKHDAKQASDIVTLVNERPGELRFGVIASSTDHFFWLHFFHQANIPVDAIEIVHYPDTGSQVEALLAGEIDFSMLNLPAAGRLFEAKALTPLGVAGEQRLTSLPAVPTLKEQGINLVNTTDRGLFAPPGTPATVLKLLAEAFGQAVQNPEVANRIERAHGSLVDYRPLDDYARYLDDQHAVLQSLTEEIAFSR
ncbi:MAG: tripartite tricarboxylate transporter substrate binding protein [Halomonas sp.]|nr:tripartite tricarboxylate transporter substrate binding protein [Halomonas sp.]